MEPQIKKWTASRKAEIVIALLKGSKQIIDICREYDLKQSEVEKWKEKFLQSGENSLKSTSDKDEKDLEILNLRAKVGELLLEIDARKKLAALTESKKKAF